MFSLYDIDQQVALFNLVAADFEERAEKEDAVRACLYRCTADGFRQCARSLTRMIERRIEEEFRDAMERGVA